MGLREEIHSQLLSKGIAVITTNVDRGQEKGIDTITVEVLFNHGNSKYKAEFGFAKNNKMSGEDMANVITSHLRHPEQVENQGKTQWTWEAEPE